MATIMRSLILTQCLAGLVRQKLNVTEFFNGYREARSLHEYMLRSAMNACEILTAHSQADSLVDQVLAVFLAEDLRRIDRRDTHEGAKLNILFRAYALEEARAGRTRPSTGFTYRDPSCLQAIRSDHALIGGTSRNMTGRCLNFPGRCSAFTRLQQKAWSRSRQALMT